MKKRHSEHRKYRSEYLKSMGLGLRQALLGMVLGAAAWTVLSGIAKAEWPERPITIVVMYSAGGGTDTVIRTLEGEMKKKTMA